MCVHSQSVLPCSQIGVYYCRLPVYSVDVIFFVFGCVLLFSLDHSDPGLACTGLHLIHIYLFTGSSSSPFPALRPSGGRKPTNQPTNGLTSWNWVRWIPLAKGNTRSRICTATADDAGASMYNVPQKWAANRWLRFFSLQPSFSKEKMEAVLSLRKPKSKVVQIKIFEIVQILQFFIFINPRFCFRNEYPHVPLVTYEDAERVNEPNAISLVKWL